MNLITTTELRTKSSQLVSQLQVGKSVDLIHRSKIIGTIEPYVEKKSKKSKDTKAFLKAMRALTPKKKLSYAEREKIYRKHMEKKYGPVS